MSSSPESDELPRTLRLIVAVLCVAYAAVALVLLFNPDSGLPRDGSNFVPFDTIRLQLRLGFARQLIGNALLLAPIGFTLIVWGVRLRTTVLGLLVIALTIEAAQGLVGRVTDIDDVILNVLGGFAGALIAIGTISALAAIRRRRPPHPA